MPTYALVLPIIIPLSTAIFCLFAYWQNRLQRWISLAGALTLFGAALWLLLWVWKSGIQVVQIGSWQAPFGVTLIADLFSAIMVLLTGVIGLAVAIYSIASIDQKREKFGYHALYHFLLMGVCGAFLTGDLFNLYVWFEVMLMASFVLMVLGGERQQMEGAVKYVTLNLISSSMFLAAVAILYGLVGTLNMADIARKFQQMDSTQFDGILTAVAMLFLVAFGIKSAAFPLFFWLPASYHTPPPAVSALFAGLLTKVGVYALIRVFTLIFIHNTEFTHTLILVIAGLTMVSGVLGAVAQNEFRRVLSFHIVSQIGYMIMGLALFTPLALAGSVFYITHHIIVKTNLFLISGVVERLGGTGELKKLGGLYQQKWAFSLLFLVPALSLAGIPPFSGFFAKLSLVQAGLLGQSYIIVAVSLGVSLLTLFSMTKLWNEAFWKSPPVGGPVLAQPLFFEKELEAVEKHSTPTDMRTEAPRTLGFGWFFPIAALAFITVMIGLGAGSVFALALRAGEELMNPAGYIQAVFGG